MDGFQGIDLIHQKDGMVTRIAPIHYEERQKHARVLAQQRRSEGYNKVEAYGYVKACNLTAYRPMLADEELKEIIEPIFAKPLVFSGLERNRQVLELIKVFRKRRMDDDEIFRRTHFFNSRCCNPPLPDEDLTWIMKNNAYMAEKRNFFQADKDLTQDGKTLVRIGQTVDLRKGRA